MPVLCHLGWLLMSTLDVVAEVLREAAPRALKARQIAALAGTRLPTASRTPETVVSRDLAIDVRDRGARSRFLRVERGAFVLKEALPRAFYNDNDVYAASWTNNLIAAGEIAEGIVDERSVRDLKPADVAVYRQCHFFSGIGVWSRALRDAGWPDDANVWSGSCPCIPFSQAGRKRGFSDEQHLWPEWFRLIKACRPAVVIGEQVSSKDGLAWFDAVRVDLENENYSIRVLDTPAAGVGAPHRRQRLYFVAYARERGPEILSAPWLHDRRQSRDDAARRSSLDRGTACRVSDPTGARSSLPEDSRSDRCDARESPEAIEWGSSGHFELERSGPADDGVETDELGNTGFARGRRDAGEVSRTQGTGEGEWIKTGDLADEPVASSSIDGGSDTEVGMVRRATVVTGDGSSCNGHFQPGDRIRLGGDPSWGGAVRGFWAEAVEWIYCRPEPGHQDGRWRPAESGTQPLVTGTASNLGRTRAPRLRAYGNALVLPQATTFIVAVIDAFVDAVEAHEATARAAIMCAAEDAA